MIWGAEPGVAGYYKYKKKEKYKLFSPNTLIRNHIHY